MDSIERVLINMYWTDRLLEYEAGTIIRAEDRARIAKTDPTEPDISASERDLHANRIVNCVNALRFMPDKALVDKDAVWRLFEGVAKLLDEYADIAQEHINNNDYVASLVWRPTLDEIEAQLAFIKGCLEVEHVRE